MTKISGIYKIENIKNHKVYIGSSKDIEKRWKEHLYALRLNKHHSCKLQSCYNRLKNKSTLQFDVVEIVNDISNLKIREQYYIDLFDSYNNGYNCSEKTDNPKYTLKNQKKSENNKLSKQYYKEFDELYKQDCFVFPNKILDRIKSSKYKQMAIYRITIMMKLFIKYFIKSPYLCRIYFDGKPCYMEIHTDKGYYVRYKFQNDQAIADYPVSICDINMQSYRNNYCEELLELFKKFPTIN